MNYINVIGLSLGVGILVGAVIFRLFFIKWFIRKQNVLKILKMSAYKPKPNRPYEFVNCLDEQYGVFKDLATKKEFIFFLGDKIIFDVGEYYEIKLITETKADPLASGTYDTSEWFNYPITKKNNVSLVY